MKTWLTFNWLKVIAVIAVLGALWGSLPYVYYQLMNWVAVGASIVISWQAYKQNKPAAVWFFLLVAVVFNPIAPLYLRADIWQIVDIAAALLFLISFLIVRPQKGNGKKG